MLQHLLHSLARYTKRTALCTLCVIALAGCTPVAIEQTHIHEITFNPSNPDELYLASHTGLLKLKQNGKAYRIGQSLDDFMSFAVDPSNPQVMYRSGHPLKGGNSGFWRSLNGGEDWEKMSMGNPNRNADFHALLVHPANPSYVYGWFKLRVHRSMDNGKTWEILPNQPPEAFAFAGDPNDERVLYIATFDGIWRSQDYGENWQPIIDEMKSGLALDVVSDASGNLYVAMRSRGFFYLEQKPNDQWDVHYLGNLPHHEEPMNLAVHPLNPSIMYAVSKTGTIYHSENRGATWHAVTHGKEEHHEHAH